jgi:hypothetical protein
MNEKYYMQFFSISIFLLLVLSSMAYSNFHNLAIAKKHPKNNEENNIDNPLPTINTSTQSSGNNANSVSSQPKTNSYNSIKDTIDNQTDVPVVFVGNIVKKMSESKQLHIMGEVQNTGTVTINPVVITFVYYNAQNNTIGNDFANPIPASLGPHQTAPFDAITPDFISANEIASIKYHITK